MSKETIATTAAAILAVCAASLTAVNIRREFFPPPTRPVNTVSDWMWYAAVGHRIGPAKAAVTVVVFSDYECPFCRTLERELSVLRKDYPEDLAVVWRHFPLEGHEFALPAAKAAVCAAEQESFAAFHQRLFQRVELLGTIPWSVLAASAGVHDTSVFNDCLRGEAPALIVERDVSAARRLGVNATPTLLINSAQFRGLPGDLEKIIRRQLAPG